MATPDQQRRTAEITRVLAANGWGVIAIRDEGATTSVTLRKPTSTIRTGTVTENSQALRFLIEQFRWQLAQYSATSDHHEATISTT